MFNDPNKKRKQSSSPFDCRPIFSGSGPSCDTIHLQNDDDLDLNLDLLPNKSSNDEIQRLEALHTAVSKQLQEARLKQELATAKDTVEALHRINTQLHEQIKDFQSATKDHLEQTRLIAELKLKIASLEDQVDNYKRVKEDLVGEVARFWGMWRGCMVREALRNREDDRGKESHIAKESMERDGNKRKERREEEKGMRSPQGRRADPPTVPRSDRTYR